MLQVQEQRFPCSPCAEHGEAAVLLQPMDDHRSQSFTCSRWMPEEGWDPVGACAGAGSWKNLWTHGERSLFWNRFAGRTWNSMENLL